MVWKLSIEDCDLSQEFYSFYPANTERFRVCENGLTATLTTTIHSFVVDFEDDSSQILALRYTVFALCALLMLLTVLIMVGTFQNKKNHLKILVFTVN